MDSAGGSADGAFFLKNGGGFAEPVKLGTHFERPTGGKAPEIDFAALEEVE